MKDLKFDNVFLDRGKIYTKNKTPGKDVYGERLYKDGGVEYRQWDPTRSKLGAAITKKINLPNLKKDDVWLYLGAASGTTVSHVSDIVTDGMVFALDFAPRVLRDLYFLAKERKNIAPIFANAGQLSDFEHLLTGVDVLFQDIATREQVKIFLKNFKFLKRGGYALLSVKARSIDVAKKPKAIFKEVERVLQGTDFLEITAWAPLEPYEKDHAMFVCKKK